MLLSTLFFTLQVYTLHVVTCVTTQPFKGREIAAKISCACTCGVRHEWGKLTHNDVEQIKGDVEMLAGKIEERYGVTKAEARKQIEQWVSKFQAHQTDQSDSDTQAN